MKKLKKSGSVILVAMHLLVCSLATSIQTAEVSAQESITSKSIFSEEQESEIRKYIKEEIDKLSEYKKTNENNEDVLDLQSELARQKRKARRYKHKLDAKKDYVSPKDVQAAIDKEKLALIIEFNHYLIEYSNRAENKGKTLKHVDLTNMFQQFINLNLNLNLNNPGEITIAQYAV